MESTPSLPIPISLIGGQYFLFSIDAVTYLRREHRICGVLIGSLPQAPQQNVFLGLPLQLMPEESRLLVEKGLAYIVDESIAHRHGVAKSSKQNRQQYMESLQSKARDAAEIQAGAKEKSKAKAMSKSPPKAAKAHRCKATDHRHQHDADNSIPSAAREEESLFSPPSPSERESPEPSPPAKPTPSLSHTHGITPTTSTLLLTPIPPPSPLPALETTKHKPNPPQTPPSYPLFKHLHSTGHFVSPGLRFGCEYLVYPGDPLRFHSHFLASHVDWDAELDLMDVIVGGAGSAPA